MSTRHPLLSAAIVVSALGYFVDVFDLILFLVVRVESLTDLGVPADKITEVGVHLLNCQMLGLLVGGVLWGVLGDKLGRMQALFGSIVMYSTANLANAFVQNVELYALLRLIAGIGLAGELGAGVTLVAELLPQRLRGYGTTIIAAVGVLGAIAAGLIGHYLGWRNSYLLGGIMGVLLLLVRISVSESALFNGVKHSGVARGDLALLLNPQRLMRYIFCILLGLPIWFILGILLSLAPEMSKALGAPEAPNPGLCVSWCYFGIFMGDIIGGVLSQWLASRKKAIALFLVLSMLTSAWFLTLSAPSVSTLYASYVALGVAGGYWVLVVTTSAEQFGTNLRATITTTVPNFIRGALVPMTELFVYLKTGQGTLGAAAWVGLLVIVLAWVSLFKLRETFSADLDFVER